MPGYLYLNKANTIGSLLISLFFSLGVNAASYNSTTGEISISKLSLNNTAYYQLTLQLAGVSPIAFQIGNYSLVNNSDTTDATYDSTTQILSIPQLSISDQSLAVEFKLAANSEAIQFELVSYTQNQQQLFKIVDTAQTDCFNSSGSQVSCSGSGQDGEYVGNQPSYTANNDGTVTDNVSGLIWVNSSDTDGDGTIEYEDKLSYSEAVQHCNNLEYAGQTDWRLPSIKTMYSLMNFNGEDISGADSSNAIPFIDTDYFGFSYGFESAGERDIDTQYATSSIYVSTTMNAGETMFGVNMADGRIKGYPTSNKVYAVQCVRGNESYDSNDLVDNNDETISDQATGLMWQKNDSQSAMDWDAAISYCESATTANYSDWYLPNAKELQSIVDYSRSPDTTSSAAIDPLFNATSFTNEAGDTDWGFYWTGTTHKSTVHNKNAVYVAFGRALGYMNNQWLDVHGAGAQRSAPKVESSLSDPSYVYVTDEQGETAITHGPQGDVIRTDNYVRCVRKQ